MKDLIIKKNKLRNDAMRLREVKFEENMSNEHSISLNKVQDNLWKKYQFYDHIIKAINKEDSKK